jgi:hypothetical protein
MSADLQKRRVVISARVSEFSVPPVRDALVFGVRAPVGCVAMLGALQLLVPETYERIQIDDSVVSDIVVRTALLRRAGRDKLVAWVLEDVKPIMTAEEIAHLHLEIEALIQSAPA